MPPERTTPELEAVVAGFFSSESLLETVQVLEQTHMDARVEIAQIERVLTRRTDALVRARRLLGERAERIAALEAELAAARAAEPTAAAAMQNEPVE